MKALSKILHGILSFEKFNWPQSVGQTLKERKQSLPFMSVKQKFETFFFLSFFVTEIINSLQENIFFFEKQPTTTYVIWEP